MLRTWYAEQGFPWLLDRLEGPRIAAQRAATVAAARGHVLDLGFGTGKSLPHYDGDAVTSVVGVEPSAGMLRRAAPRCREAGFPVRLVQAHAEALPFGECVFDTVVCSTVLCTVTDLRRTLSEVRRVLVPQGRLVFLEHVAHQSARVRAWQDFLNPLQRVIGCGCNLNRETVAAVEEAGLEVRGLVEDTWIGTPGIRWLVPTVRGEGVRRG